MFYNPQFASLGQLLQLMMSQRQAPQIMGPQPAMGSQIQPATSNVNTAGGVKNTPMQQPKPIAMPWNAGKLGGSVAQSMWDNQQRLQANPNAKPKPQTFYGD